MPPPASNGLGQLEGDLPHPEELAQRASKDERSIFVTLLVFHEVDMEVGAVLAEIEPVLLALA